MKHSTWRSASGALVVALIGVGGLVASPAPAHAASVKCVYSGSSSTCYQVTSTAKSTFKAIWSDALVNDASRAARLECSVDETKSFSATASASVSASVKAWIVAKMDASVGASVTMTATATRGSHISTTVPAHSVVICDRGTYTYVGNVRKTGASGQHALRPTTFTVRAPSFTAWRFRQP